MWCAGWWGGHNQCGMSLVEFVFHTFIREFIFLNFKVLVEGRAKSRAAILNRPSALNALTPSMVGRLSRLYESWEDNSDIGFVMMKGNGRAFCSGADVVTLYELIKEEDHSNRDKATYFGCVYWNLNPKVLLFAGQSYSVSVGKRGKVEECKKFFQTLYKFVYLLGTYLKPNVAILDGVTMGSGAGISLPGMFRVVTDRTKEGEEKQRTSTTKSYQSYKEAFNTSRWPTEATKKMEIQSSVAGLDISGGISASGEDVLNRCVVGRCGGFIETEEETTLKNHLYWAWIKVRGDGKKIPKELEISDEGFVYQILIWTEATVTVRKKEVAGLCPKDNRGQKPFLMKEVMSEVTCLCPEVNRGQKSFLMKEVVQPQLSHVETSNGGEFLNSPTCAKGRKYKDQIKKKKQMGLLDPLVLNAASPALSGLKDTSEDIINIEIFANSQEPKLTNRYEHLGNQMEEKERHAGEISQLREVAIIENATYLCNGGEGEKQIVEKEGESSIVIAVEAAVPLKVQAPTEVLQSTNSIEWIQQNIMRLSREFGVDFKGCKVSSLGMYIVTCSFSRKTQEFQWHMTGVYGPNDKQEREETWWEIGAARGLATGPWVLCGDFNTTKHPLEKKNYNRISKAMTDFSEFIEDMELVDPELIGGSTHGGEVNTKYLSLRTGDCRHQITMKESRASGILLTILKPDYILASKLKALKTKLKEWSKTTQGNLGAQKQNVLSQLVELDMIQEQRELNEEEIASRVEEEDNTFLMAAFEEQEILESIKACAEDKAPGPDGYSMAFFKQCWEVIKKDLIAAIRNFHEKGFFERSLNATFVALIPKKWVQYEQFAAKAKSNRWIRGFQQSPVSASTGVRFIYPINEVLELENLAIKLGGTVGKLPIIYLGMLLGANSKSLGIWNGVIEKYEKLTSWKSQYLSRGGSIKGVLSSWNNDGNASSQEERWKIVPACIWWTVWNGMGGIRDVYSNPEAQVGFHPDAGASYYLSRLPGYLGKCNKILLISRFLCGNMLVREYLALTGGKLNGVEMIACGLATHYSLKERLPWMEERLGKLITDDPLVIESSLAQYGDLVYPDTTSVLHKFEKIDKCFSQDTVEEIIEALEREAAESHDEWCNTVLNKIKAASPLSLKVALKSIREGRFQPLDQCLVREYRISDNWVSKKVSDDFCEGVRARLVDKDFAPKWGPARLEEVTTDMVDCFFIPLDELEPELNLATAIREPSM
ncbi:3-hydroxyisobutyryl-CoA hydrolase-like protein 2, mitochondrial [Capsicum annuum]|nr:3-hydroxyisobutyryl-CoA hydrolase-like protein 2, mitochondrial [Capsicum annuum]